MGQLLAKFVVFDLVRLEDAGLVSTRREGGEEMLQQHEAGSRHTLIVWFKVTMPKNVFPRRTTVLYCTAIQRCAGKRRYVGFHGRYTTRIVSMRRYTERAERAVKLAVRKQ